jgi:Putative auto-transporter adhesin, head GIN domain
MKKLAIITSILMFTTSLSVFAKEKKRIGEITKKEFYQLSFSKIIVSNDIDIRLSESRDRVIEISGDHKYFQQVEWKIKEGVLYIRSKAGSLKNKVEVSISVTELNNLYVTGDSNVKSEGALNSKELKIFFGGEGRLSIKNTGTIKIERGDSVNVNVQRVTGNVKVD